jgi:hypothetical protein
MPPPTASLHYSQLVVPPCLIFSSGVLVETPFAHDFPSSHLLVIMQATVCKDSKGGL